MVQGYLAYMLSLPAPERLPAFQGNLEKPVYAFIMALEDTPLSLRDVCRNVRLLYQRMERQHNDGNVDDATFQRLKGAIRTVIFSMVHQIVETEWHEHRALFEFKSIDKAAEQVMKELTDEFDLPA